MKESKDILVFYSKSPDSKYPGNYSGKGWSEYVENKEDYKELSEITGWRKMLSNFYVSPKPFVLDNYEWSSVEHYFHAMKYRSSNNKQNSEFLKTFTVGSDSPWCNEPSLAKMAGKAGRISPTTGKIYYKKIGGVNIPKDVIMHPDFYSKNDNDDAMSIADISMTAAFLAKFCQDDKLKAMLLSTNDAMLYHLVTVRGKGSKLQLWKHLMKVRDCIRKYDCDLELDKISRQSSSGFIDIVL